MRKPLLAARCLRWQVGFGAMMSRCMEVVAVALLLAPSQAQEQAWSSWGSANLRVDGNSAVVGDVNQDGYEDFACICDGRCLAPVGAWGYVRMMSGRDGVVLYDVAALPVANGPYFRDVSAAGDWNHDGVRDFATMQWAFPVTNFVVHDGATGAALLVQPEFGLEILADCDVNGDGWNDMVIADSSSSLTGVVTVRSHGGVIMYQIGGSPALQIGNHLASIGDIDDDGGDDFVVTGMDSALRGASVVVSGRTGAFIRICYGEQPGDWMGSFVDAAGDWDGDGYQEFVVAGLGGRPGCVVYSARSGQVMRSWYSTTSSTYAQFVAGRGIDYDGDSFPDIVAGDPLGVPQGGTAGMVHVLSGRNGTIIHRLQSEPVAIGVGRIGAWVNGLRPGPGSHVGTVIAPDKQALLSLGTCPSGPVQGLVRAYRGLPRTAALIGPSCAGNLLVAPDIGLQSVPGGIQVHLSDAPPGVLAVLLLGAVGQASWVPTPLALDGIGLPGCSLWGPIDLMSILMTGSGGSNGGYGSTYLPLPVPPPPSGVGSWWVSAQWWVLGSPTTFPGGMTQSVRWRR